MQGLIFNLLGERVTETWGEGYWAALVAETPGIESPVFVGPKNYPDDSLVSLLTRVSTDRAIAMDRLLLDAGAFPSSRQRIRCSFRGMRARRTSS